MMQKLQSYSLAFLLLANLLAAAEEKPLEPLDEEFLEFIANMSEVDGEVIDPLDMLEVADNDMSKTTLIEKELNGENKPDENTELSKLNSVSRENK